MTKSNYRLSNSALDLYQQCPKKYYFRYKENLKGNFTSTPLLFGSAIDSALNYILESMRDKKPWAIETACTIFYTKMNEWKGQNRLEFFKNEVPEELQDSVNPNNPDHQEAVWQNLCKRGIACLFVYEKEICSQIGCTGFAKKKICIDAKLDLFRMSFACLLRNKIHIFSHVSHCFFASTVSLRNVSHLNFILLFIFFHIKWFFLHGLAIFFASTV